LRFAQERRAALVALQTGHLRTQSRRNPVRIESVVRMIDLVRLDRNLVVRTSKTGQSEANMQLNE
jgi:cobalamin biosynthesis protein CbiD